MFYNQWSKFWKWEDFLYQQGLIVMDLSSDNKHKESVVPHLED